MEHPNSLAVLIEQAIADLPKSKLIDIDEVRDMLLDLRAVAIAEDPIPTPTELFRRTYPVEAPKAPRRAEPNTGETK